MVLLLPGISINTRSISCTKILTNGRVCPFALQLLHMTLAPDTCDLPFSKESLGAHAFANLMILVVPSAQALSTSEHFPARCTRFMICFLSPALSKLPIAAEFLGGNGGGGMERSNLRTIRHQHVCPVFASRYRSSVLPSRRHLSSCSCTFISPVLSASSCQAAWLSDTHLPPSTAFLRGRDALLRLISDIVLYPLRERLILSRMDMLCNAGFWQFGKLRSSVNY